MMNEFEIWFMKTTNTLNTDYVLDAFSIYQINVSPSSAWAGVMTHTFPAAKLHYLISPLNPHLTSLIDIFFEYKYILRS